MLGVATELGRKAANALLEVPWCHMPNPTLQVGVGASEHTKFFALLFTDM